MTRSYFEDVLDDGVKVTSGRSRREDEGWLRRVDGPSTGGRSTGNWTTTVDRSEAGGCSTGDWWLVTGDWRLATGDWRTGLIYAEVTKGLLRRSILGEGVSNERRSILGEGVSNQRRSIWSEGLSHYSRRDEGTIDTKRGDIPITVERMKGRSIWSGETFQLRSRGWKDEVSEHSSR